MPARGCCSRRRSAGCTAAPAPYIDFLVWIDTPLDLALARALLAISQSAAPPRAPGRHFLDWQVQYLQNYPLVRAMYIQQRERIAPAVELALDGAGDVEAWAHSVEAAFKARADERHGVSSASS